MIEIEKNLLRIGLILAVSYQLHQTFFSIWNGIGSTVVSLNLLITVVFLFLLYPLSLYTQIAAFIFHLIVLVVFAFFWMNSNGINETVPDMMCLYLAFIAVVSRKHFRIVALLLHTILVYILLYQSDSLSVLTRFDFTNVSLLQISIEYGIVALFIVIFVCYMKASYQGFHDKSVKRYKQLQRVGSRLRQQNEELQSRHEEVKMINENLEFLVQERSGEIEKKNAELSEYAFINAHMLRGPLSRVIGLSDLMGSAPEEYPPEKVRAIKALANEMDLIVRQISKVLD